MLKYLAPLFLFFSSAAMAVGNDSLYLIPQPKLIESQNGTFSFKRPPSIYSFGADTFCVEQLYAAIAAKYHAGFNKSKKKATTILLVKVNAEDLTRLLRDRKRQLPFDLGEEGYYLDISEDNIVIAAHTDAGIFYGVQTLTQLVNANSRDKSIPCLTIFDKPDMQMRGWQDDISRGPIPTLNFLKEEVRRMASYKLNTFTLYTEHVFKLKKHPSIAPADGISAEEIEELVRYAKDYHVDVIGNFQSFGHFANILDKPGYENLAENFATLSPCKEESYRFLSDVYSEVAPAYSSKYFHINCDEVSLGNGPCKQLIDSIGVAGVYANHINRIDSLLKPYHKQIMMWGDIAVNNPQIIERLPKDMIIVSWDYGPLESEDDNILPFKKSGFRFVVAPGVSCWSRIYPDLNRAIINIYSYLRDGCKNGALGFINTTWDDSGQNLFNNNWYGLIWGADCGWNAPPDEPQEKSIETRKRRVVDFNRRFNEVYFGTNANVAGLLLAFSDLRNGPVKNCLSDGSLWSPLLPYSNIVPDGFIKDNISLKGSIDSLSNVANAYRRLCMRNVVDFDLLGLAMRQSKLIAAKNLLAVELNARTNDSVSQSISMFSEEFRSLSDTVEALKATYDKLWRLENRNWWLDTVNSYYDDFENMLNDSKGVTLINAAIKLVAGKRVINLRSAFDNLPVYYTIDGSKPGLNSPRYSGPILCDSDVIVRACAVENGKIYPEAADSFIFHKGIGKLYRLNTIWNTEHNVAYAAGGDYGLLDGRRGSSTNFSDGRWQGYLGNDIDIELDLEKETELHSVSIRMGQLMRYGIMMPERVEVGISANGKDYTPAGTVLNSIDPKQEARAIYDFTVDMHGAKARYVHVVAKNSGPLPEWHYAKGKPSWLFADEIVVK